MLYLGGKNHQHGVGWRPSFHSGFDLRVWGCSLVDDQLCSLMGGPFLLPWSPNEVETLLFFQS